MPQQGFSFLVDDYQQPDSKDTENENEKSSEDGGPDHGKNGKFRFSSQHDSSPPDDNAVPNTPGATRRDSYVFWSTIVVQKAKKFTLSLLLCFLNNASVV